MKKNNGLSFFIPKKETGLDAILINTGISAGFPSPAGDYKQERISLDKELIKNQEATFFARVPFPEPAVPSIAITGLRFLNIIYFST